MKRERMADLTRSPTSGGIRRANIALKSQEPSKETESRQYVPKSVDTRKTIRVALQNHYLFESIGERDMDYVIDAMSREMFGAGDRIFSEGEVGEKFYVVECGRCNVIQKIGDSASGKEIIVGEIETGGCFGELALLYDTPRAASIEAAETCRVWSVSRDTFRRILATTAASSIQEKCQFLRNIEIFKLLTNSQVSALRCLAFFIHPPHLLTAGYMYPFHSISFYIDR